LLCCSIVLSVFVIFTALIDGSQNFYHQGELLHQCARRIAAINHKLKNIDIDGDQTEAKAQLETLETDYQRALDECPINHENIDFYREIIRKPHLFPDAYPWKKKWMHRTAYRIRAFTVGNSWAPGTFLCITKQVGAGDMVMVSGFRAAKAAEIFLRGVCAIIPRFSLDFLLRFGPFQGLARTPGPEIFFGSSLSPFRSTELQWHMCRRALAMRRSSLAPGRPMWLRSFTTSHCSDDFDFWLVNFS
jgi:hypothetical protein